MAKDYDTLQAEAAAGFRAIAEYCQATRASYDTDHPSCCMCPIGILCKGAVGNQYLCDILPAMADAVVRDDPLS